jgi:hypothetical protein
MLRGGLPQVWGMISKTRRLRKAITMATINPIFGLFCLAGGLALAVALGIFLYKDRSRQLADRPKVASLTLSEEN